MKKYLTKILKITVVMAIVFCIIFVLAYLGIYLSGAWGIKILGLALSFKSLTSVSILSVYIPMIGRDQVDKILSTHDAKLKYKVRKKLRWRQRLVFCAVWAMVYGIIFIIGQANGWHNVHRYEDSLGLFDLGLVCLYGIFFSTIIPIPKQPKQKKK